MSAGAATSPSPSWRNSSPTTVGYRGGLRYASEMPDGAPRKLLDVSRLAAFGWRPRIELREGLADAYRWFTEYVAETG